MSLGEFDQRSSVLPSFLAQLQAAKARTLKRSDPWTPALLTLKGNKGRDGVEWITTEAVFEALDLPRLSRTPEAAKKVKACDGGIGLDAAQGARRDGAGPCLSRSRICPSARDPVTSSG
jgi:hypothetical protein